MARFPILSDACCLISIALIVATAVVAVKTFGHIIVWV